MQPPAVIQFNASNVPVVQMTLSSKTLTEQQIFDYSLNFIRVRLFTIPGLSTPGPFGGKSRQINVDSIPARLQAKGFSPTDVVNALQASNVIVPAGTARIGEREYNVQLNSSPSAVDRFNALPIGVFNGAPVTLGDVAHVSDSFAMQTNIVHVNGKRAVYLAILKHADASTLAVVDAARDALAGNPGRGAERAGTEARFRPVGVRARRGAERDPRGDHLVDPGLGTDPGVPGQLAQHGDRLRPRSRCRSSPASSACSSPARPST